MSARHTICAIEPAAAKFNLVADPAATLILGTLLLLIRP
jgi:hypothetical protein